MDQGRPDGGFDAALSAFTGEVLRWNSQINLVSRRGSRSRVEILTVQCREAFDLLLAHQPSESGFWAREGFEYFDLGSGAGFPGVIWNLEFHRRGLCPNTVLIEPREKRAWFLNRIRSLKGMPPFSVATGRWGATMGSEGEAASGRVLVSLKALRLSDAEVIEGLRVFWGGRCNPAGGLGGLIIVRFCPPDQIWNAAVIQELGIPAQGTEINLGGGRLVHAGGAIFGPSGGITPAGLIVSEYLPA